MLFNFKILFFCFILASVYCKPFNRLISKFSRLPHLSAFKEKSENSLNYKNKIDRTVKSSATDKQAILPIIYPILLTPNTMQYLASSLISSDPKFINRKFN